MSGYPPSAPGTVGPHEARSDALLLQCTALLEYLSMWVAMTDIGDECRDPDAEIDALLRALWARAPAPAPGARCLTDEEIEAAWDRLPLQRSLAATRIDFARAVLALREAQQ